MCTRRMAALIITMIGSYACSGGGSGSDSEVTDTSPLTPAAGAGSGGTMSSMPGTPTPAGPAAGTDDAAIGDDTPFVVFMDAATGFMTDEVHDAEREIVHFDAALGAMVSSETGDRVSGWNVTDADLRWSRSGVPFRVRFGTEESERRAYFTEAGPGTICDLSLVGPDVLFISGTNQTPPNP
jgi:hypothetical protein